MYEIISEIMKLMYGVNGPNTVCFSVILTPLGYDCSFYIIPLHLFLFLYFLKF